MNKNRRAFTLIEFLIILSIVTILAGMFLPVIVRRLNQPQPAPAPARAPGATRVAIVVLDASGSMGDNMPAASGTIQKMAAAKQALATAIAGLPDSVWVGVLVFSGTGHSDEWLYVPGPLRLGQLNAALRSLEPSGGTPLGYFLGKAIDRLLMYKDVGLQLVVVTDGEAGDPDRVTQQASRLAGTSIRLDVIGVAMAEDHVLKGVATSYTDAKDSEKLRSALVEILAEAPDESAPPPAPEPDSSTPPPAPEQ